MTDIIWITIYKSKLRQGFQKHYLYTENMKANLSFAAMNLRKNLRKQFSCKGKPSWPNTSVSLDSWISFVHINVFIQHYIWGKQSPRTADLYSQKKCKFLYLYGFCKFPKKFPRFVYITTSCFTQKEFPTSFMRKYLQYTIYKMHFQWIYL